MKRHFKLPMVVLGLLASGAARLAWEPAMTQEFREAGLLAQPVQEGTRDKIGQTSWAIALGGLRTLVATILNLRAYSFFEAQRWDELADTFDLIVDLAPNTTYYWETGSWHMAYNASSFYRFDSELPALRRRELWRGAILRGRAFLERGVRINPGRWEISLALGRLLSDANRITDYPAAVVAFKAAADTGNAPTYARRNELFCLARCPGKEAETLALAKQLFAVPNNRVSTMCCLMLALDARENPNRPTLERIRACFPGETDKSTYGQLCDYWVRTRERFPLDGVAAALQELEERLNVPVEKSVFNRGLRPDQGPESWFKGK